MATTGDLDDVATVVAAARNGDENAWATLVDRFNGLVWAVARGHRLSHADATDVSQTVWLRLAQNLALLREPAAVGGWLATVTRNESLRLIRQSARAIPTEVMPEPRETVEVTIGVDVDLTDRTIEALWTAFEQLTDRCRIMLRLLMADPPPPYAEISAALDIPIGSIGPTRARCLARLRGLLGDARITDADRDSW